MSFDEQKQLRKVLIEPADGDETDYESANESDNEGLMKRDPSYEEK